VYFINGRRNGRKRRDLTIAMDPGSKICQKYGMLKSSEIKNLIGVYSYKDLILKARRADRSLSGYIKHRLRQKADKGG
jgi:hypothetical protein